MVSELKEIYSDFEAEFWPQFDKVSSFTMTSPERLYSLWNAAKYLKQNDISGDFVECGVWRGGSSMMAALALMAQGDFSRRIWLYDTFEGMPKPGAKDVQIRSGKHAQTYLDTEERLPAYNTWAIAQLDEVECNLFSTGYPRDKMIFCKGLVQDTLLQKLPDKIAILRLDTDWYDSTLTELQILWPRLVPSGLLFIDDYGWWKGQRQAVDEYFSTQRFKPYFFRIDVAMVMVVKT